MKSALWFAATLLFCTAATAAVPSSINNDDSCDIKVGPAATLLLPYFEVDVNGTSGRTTLFTITNVSRYPQIAHVTLWSDWAYPVLSFNLFLTGYDIQAINIADFLIRGSIAPPGGTSQATSPGSLSASTNPNIRSPLDCGGTSALLPPTLLAAARSALTTGIFKPGGGITECSVTGGVHDHAIGYATIDVVSSCTTLMPSDPAYYTNNLLFDNVLIGDYQQLGASPAGTGAASAFGAAGNPMVHIRAVPEGGAGSNIPTSLPYTFYDRYTPSATRTIDRRQPLPATFAARYIEGGPSRFVTGFTIWREGNDGFHSSCAPNINNAFMRIAETVRFDEHENAFGRSCSVSPEACDSDPFLQVDSITSSSSRVFPPLSGTDVGGWFYLNLNNGGSVRYSAQTNLAPTGSLTSAGPRPSQNWVTISMFGGVAGNRMSVEMDAAPLGNGCTPAAGELFDFSFRPPAPGKPPISPAGGVFVCPPGTTLTDGTTALCTGTNVNPIP